MNINGKSAAAALVKARAAIGATITKDARANYGKYATLAAVMEAISPALAANGLALVQEAELGDNAVTMAATLVHESGETIEFTPLTMPLGSQRTPQAVGSAMTYGRRYQLTALFGLAPDDDDGETASKTTQASANDTGTPASANGRAMTGEAGPPRMTTDSRASYTAQPAAVTLDAAPPVSQDGPDNLFEVATPTDAELEILGKWRNVDDAYAWAVASGGCQNEFEARNSLKKMVVDQFDGKFTKTNAGAVYLAYLQKQQSKAQAQVTA